MKSLLAALYYGAGWDRVKDLKSPTWRIFHKRSNRQERGISTFWLGLNVIRIRIHWMRISHNFFRCPLTDQKRRPENRKGKRWFKFVYIRITHGARILAPSMIPINLCTQESHTVHEHLAPAVTSSCVHKNHTRFVNLVASEMIPSRVHKNHTRCASCLCRLVSLLGH